jgi:RsiW-degrading membrane proteinase PrsW (M82 family)
MGALAPGLQESSVAGAIYNAFLVAALCEEVCKYLLLRIGSWRNRNFNYRFDGIVYGVSVAAGFAILENAFYLINSSNFTMLSAVIRAFGAGLMHGMCTLLVGVGISFVKKKRKLFAVGTFGLLSTAIVYHGIYNILIQSKYSIIGACLPIATYIPFLIWRLMLKKRKHTV